jgi:hypothetical protein
MKKELGNKGFFKNIFLLLLLVGVVFIGISFAKPYYRYFTLSSHTKDYLLSDTYNPEAIRKHIMADAEELNVPLAAQDLIVKVDLQLKKIRVTASWTETVDFWGYYQQELNFSMEEEY